MKILTQSRLGSGKNCGSRGNSYRSLAYSMLRFLCAKKRVEIFLHVFFTQKMYCNETYQRSVKRKITNTKTLT